MTETPKRVRVHHLREAKEAGRRLTMLTAYDAVTARIFDEAGVDMLLVGDSIGNTMHGHATTLPVTVEDHVYHGDHVRVHLDCRGQRLVAKAGRRDAALAIGSQAYASFNRDDCTLVAP